MAGSFPNYVVYILIAVVAALILIIGILLCVVLYRQWRKRRHRDTYRNVERSPEPATSTLLSSRDRHRKVDVHTTEWVAEPGPLSTRHPPIEAEQLLQEFQKKEENNNKLFNEEFDSIPRLYPQYSAKAMDAPENSKKNRYPKDIVAVYDYSRVRLQPDPAVEDSTDYINANYVKQTNGSKQYIVSQAPMRNTQKDFWRMVWENEVCIIIMLCDLWRKDWELSYYYWPDENSPSRSHTYGHFRVTALTSQRYADHTVRTFNIEDMASAEALPRTVYHFHFTAWKEGPENILCKLPKVQFQILKFVEKINQWEKRIHKENIPLLVHCSAGTAESGMYIALDQLREQLAEQKKIDLYNCVSHMRQQRPNAIHFPSQYKYVFQTLLEQQLYGNTEVDIADLRNQVFRDTTIRTLLNDQFQALTVLPIEQRPTSIGLREVNYKKNSYPTLIIPFDDNMVPVSARPGQPDSSYINASWVDGYWEKQAYIVTQDPQRHTTAEFWRMVWEHHVTAVVMLTEPGPEPTQCYHYWPNDNESQVMFDNIIVRHDPKERRDCPGYSLRTFTVSNKQQPEMESRDIHQFHYHEWPDGSIPTHATSLLDMIAQLRDSVTSRTPVTIHCSGGGDRSSVFCAINLAMDQLKDGGKVDIFQTTRLLRHQRQYMIPTIDEYEFLWKAVLQYIETYYWMDQDQHNSQGSSVKC